MKFLRLLPLFFCLVFAKGYANCAPGSPPCGPQDCCLPCPRECSCFEVSAEWLFFLSSIDQPFFVVEEPGTGNPLGKRFANRQSWHSGYRLELRYFIPCSCGDFFRIRWTHLPCFEDRRHRNFSPGGVDFGAILIHPANDTDGFGKTSIRDRFQFYNLEVLWGRPVYCYCGLILELEFGVQYSRISFHEHVRYDNFTDEESFRVRNRAHFSGFGPEIVLDFSYCLSRCFSIKGRSAFAFLVNRRHARFDEVALSSSGTPTFFEADNDKYWFGTPSANIRVGVNYHSCLSFFGCEKWHYNIEAGYEFYHFIKSVDRIYFVDSSNRASSFVQHQDFTLHGPYLHLGVCF